MKKAFTLVELLVVIGIIGILAGIVMTSFSGGTDAARAAKCLSNMRNLAQGAISYATKTDHYPPAGSLATLFGNRSNGNLIVQERVGWISWLSKNDEYSTRRAKKRYPTSFKKLSNVSAYCDNDEDATFAITNGCLWTSVNCNFETYICPVHQRLVQKSGGKLRWSYRMSALFGYDDTKGSDYAKTGDWHGIRMSDKDYRFDRLLLFSELPFYPNSDDSPDRIGVTKSSSRTTYPTASDDPETDAVLQYKGTYNGNSYNMDWSGTAEKIEYNHANGKKGYCAHVVFADGHAEKLQKPKTDTLSQEVLTALLCSGVDVVYDGDKYTVPTDGDK